MKVFTEQEIVDILNMWTIELNKTVEVNKQMRIKKLNESIRRTMKMNELLTPDEELARGELKAMKRQYMKPVVALREFVELLEEGASPSSGIDSDTQALIDKCNNLADEIESCSYAFD